MSYGSRSFQRERRFNRPHLYILRGLPGSGKSSLAKKIMARYNGMGKILSSDDYFKNAQGDMVDFDRRELPEAHRMNRTQGMLERRRFGTIKHLRSSKTNGSFIYLFLCFVLFFCLLFKCSENELWKAMRDGMHPVIIDNTNTTCREMRSYVKMGLRFGYHIRFRYTRDTWRRSVEELHERINGKVPFVGHEENEEKIRVYQQYISCPI